VVTRSRLLGYDPTRTTMLRRRFSGEIRRLLARIKLKVLELVIKEDAFGIAPRRVFPATELFLNRTVRNQRWALRTIAQKVKEFGGWLKETVKDAISSLSGVWDRYIKEGLIRGLERAWSDTRRVGGKELAAIQAAKEEFLRSALSQPKVKEKLEVLTQRVVNDLEGVTDQMTARMVRTLTDKLSKGASPAEVGKALADEVDKARPKAESVARTETIRAHAEGQLSGFDGLGVEKVGARVELTTVGDDRVCHLCEGLEGTVMWLEDAEGVIPVHPNCRCSWEPYFGDAEPEKLI
jgi:SPP1 gp7 family putative phage head morphogenesis protein